MADKAQVHLHREGGRATVTLDSPHNRNALSTDLVAGLRDALREIEADQGVRVVVLTGEGPVFCSGADLKSAGGGTMASFTDAIERIMRLPQPVVCRLNGPARAGGIGLMAACDVVIAPDSAHFALTEVRIGVTPAVILVPILQRVDRMWLLEKCLTAEAFDAAEAKSAGLVNRVVGVDALDAEVDRFVEMLGLGGPQALALAKRLIRDADGERLADRLEHLRLLSAERFASEEAAEGLTAWMEKRRPKWSA
jgi:methylglutaconyl-CoA hydratase